MEMWHNSHDEYLQGIYQYVMGKRPLNVMVYLCRIFSLNIWNFHPKKQFKLNISFEYLHWIFRNCIEKKKGLNIYMEYFHGIFQYFNNKNNNWIFMLNILMQYFWNCKQNKLWSMYICTKYLWCVYERFSTNIYIPVGSYSCKQKLFSKSTVLPHSSTNSNNSAKERLRLYTKGHQCRVGRNKSLSHSCESRFVSLPIKKLVKQPYIAVMLYILPFNFLEETGSLIRYNNTVPISGN